MIKVQIYCPECSKMGFIEVEENIIQESSRGITAVNVAEYLVCKHSFIVYIDKNFCVRDSFITDFTIELPSIKFEESDKIFKESSEFNIDLYLININLSAIEIVYLLRAIVFKEKVLIINDLDIVHPHLINLMKYCLQNTFEFDLTIMTSNNYQDHKKQFKNHVIIEKREVINDKRKIIKNNAMKIENAIIRKFLGESDHQISLTILKSELDKLYHLSRDIIELNENLKKTEELTSKLIIDKLNDKYGFKLSKEYLELLYEIIDKYFEVKLKLANVTSDFVSYF